MRRCRVEALSHRWSGVTLAATASAVVSAFVLAAAAAGQTARLPTKGLVAFVRGPYVYLVPARGGVPRRLTPLPKLGHLESQGFSEPAWSADGKRLALGYTSNDPHEYDEIDV